MIDAAIVTAIRRRLTSALAAPRERLHPLRIEGRAIGWLDRRRASRLRGFIDVFDVGDDEIALVSQLADVAARTIALDRIARILAAEGALSAWRDERYAVAPRFGAPPWFLLERAAARYFGIHTYAAHVNGVVGSGEVRMWLARRSPAKAIDPGMLDNLVGGGIAAGQSVAATVIKEAHEEAGIDASLAGRAQPAGTVDICRAQPDGLQRETIFVHDLALPAEFRPAGIDGEVVEHRLVGLRDAARIISHAEGPDLATADSSLVILDYLLRHGAIPRDAPEYAALDALRHPACGLFA
jgi:8-oxo-dGTP pyrophosphatase MutT (NUDIX family)